MVPKLLAKTFGSTLMMIGSTERGVSTQQQHQRYNLDDDSSDDLNRQQH